VQLDLRARVPYDTYWFNIAGDEALEINVSVGHERPVRDDFDHTFTWLATGETYRVEDGWAQATCILEHLVHGWTRPGESWLGPGQLFGVGAQSRRLGGISLVCGFQLVPGECRGLVDGSIAQNIVNILTSEVPTTSEVW